MPARLVWASSRLLLEQVARHVQGLHDADRSVLLITASHPAPVLLRQLQQAGVNLDRVFILDAVGSRSGVERTHDPEHLMYLPGPTQLELMAMRADKVIRQKAEGMPHIVVLTVNSFALYNEAAALEELVRYVVTSLMRPKAWIDFVIEREAELDAGLRTFLDGFVEGRLDLD